MTRDKYLKLKSVKTFKRNIESTLSLFGSYYSALSYLHVISEELNLKKNKKTYRRFEKGLKNQEKIYEYLLISQIANFEFFMYDLVSELISKNPKSMSSEKLVSYNEIYSLKSINGVRTYLIDRVAIEKSNNILIWAKYLNDIHNIQIFHDKKKIEDSYIFKLISFFSYLRNILLHAGGKVNTKFIIDLRKLSDQDKEIPKGLKFKNRIEIERDLMPILMKVLTDFAK